MKNKNLSVIGLGLILFTALALATTAAYESIVGLADLFAARKEVVIIMAIFIEWAKLLLAGSLHMFWNEIPWWKWVGVGIIAVHMAVTNIGIYSYLSSGYLLQEAPVAALERKINTIDGDINSHATIEQEAVQRISAMDEAYRQYVENLYIRRAERYKDTNEIERARLEEQRDQARAEIRLLESKKAKLIEEKVQNAAKLGSIEHVSAFVGADQKSVLKVVVFFTILLMMGLDPAAIMMVILFTYLLNKIVRKEEDKPQVAVNDMELDEASEKAIERLKKIGYIERRKEKKR